MLTACTIFDPAGNSSKARVKTIANWKPNRACAPGRIILASVSICSIFACSGVFCRSFDCFCVMTRSRAPTAQPRQGVPETEGNEGRRDPAGDAHGCIADPLENDEDVDAERQSERQQRQIGKNRNHPVQSLAVLAALDDPVIRSGRDQQGDRA